MLLLFMNYINGMYTFQVLKLRSNYFEKLLNKDVPWFDVHNTGDFASRMAE